MSVKLLPPLAVANAMKRGTQSLDLGSRLLARAFAIAYKHRIQSRQILTSHTSCADCCVLQPAKLN